MCIVQKMFYISFRIRYLDYPTLHISCSSSSGVASLVLKSAIVLAGINNLNCQTAILHKNVPLYFLDIESVYTRFVCLVVSFSLDNMFFNTSHVTSAHYFIDF